MYAVKKALQYQCISFLQTKWGVGLFFIAFVVTLNSVLNIIDNTFTTGLVCRNAKGCNRDYTDNLVGRSYQDYLCHEPIDIVYTWVNGSDQKLLAEIEYYKRLDADTQKDHQLITNETAFNVSSEQQKLRDQAETKARDRAGANRFQDNQELRYSLRSIEKYAGWIRKIYIVTNGQVPNWLNVKHPKIEVIPHSDIYVNKSHLPTFSSPSIESHLHRIKGLSRRFIYLNDDTFFGNHIHPDDFYTKVKGHKIFLSWAVPNCNEGCPGTWIGDGYCDRPCNVSDCDFDGGDCKNAPPAGPSPNHWHSGSPNVGGGHTAGAWNSGQPNQKRWDDLCSTGCPDNWIGDKFCDSPCNVASCGFDSTDCGMREIRMHLTEIVLHPNITDYQVKSGIFAMYLNMTAVYPLESKVTAASHDSPDIVRSSTISQANKVMVLTIQKRKPTTKVLFVVEGTIDAIPMEFHFNVTFLSNVVADPNPPHASSIRATNRTAYNFSQTRTRSLQSITRSTTRITFHPLESQAPNHEKGNPKVTLEANASQVASVTRKLAGLMEKIPGDEASRVTLDSDEIDRRRLIIPYDMLLVRETPEKMWDKSIILEEPRINNTGLAFSKLDGLSHADAVVFPEFNTPFVYTAGPGSRKLKDMFGDSLKFVNKLMNRKFGNSARKVPAHMPHFIDKVVMEELWTLWYNEWDKTSASRFRASTNMQFAFAHFYYIVHATRPVDPVAFFNNVLDINENGFLDYLEYRRIAAILWDRHVTQEDLDRITTVEEQTREEEIKRRKHLESLERNCTVDNCTVSPTPIPTVTPVAVLHSAMRANENNRFEYGRGGGGGGVSRGRQDDKDDPRYGQRRLTAHASLRGLEDEAGSAEVGEEEHTVTADVYEFIDRDPWVNANGTQYEPYYEGNSSSDDTWWDAHPTTQEDSRFLHWDQQYIPKPPPNAKEEKKHKEKTMPEAYVKAAERVINLTIENGLLTAPRFLSSGLAKFVVHDAVDKLFNHENSDLDQVSFFMIRDNVSLTQHNMDHILLKRPKFICINDNMNHSHADNDKVIGVIHTFLNTYFPIPSQFELPPGTFNDFAYVEEYRARAHSTRKGIVIKATVFTVGIALLCSLIALSNKFKNRPRNARDTFV